MSIDQLITDCTCTDTSKLHPLEFSLAECRIMFTDHFGDAVQPGGGNYQQMMMAVANKVGWHHIITDVNKLRVVPWYSQLKRKRERCR